MSEMYSGIPRTAPPDYTVATVTRTESDADFVDSVTAWIPNSPIVRDLRTSRLEKPVVIPRIEISGQLSVPLPFMRAYSPELRPYGVNETEFVAFIDNLAVAQAAPVPLQALDVAGRVVGFVPYHWAAVAGAGMNIAAGVGTAAVTYGRTRYFLEKVNREYFAPRGLQVSIYEFQELIEKLAISPDAAVLGKKEPQAGIVSIPDRCMSALQLHVASLSFNVPQPSVERNILDRIAAKGIERKRRNQNKKSEEDEHSSDSSSDSSSEEDKERRKVVRRVRKINSEARKDLRKHPGRAVEIEEDRARRVQEFENKAVRSTGKSTRKTANITKKDLKKAKRLEFVVVETLTL